MAKISEQEERKIRQYFQSQAPHPKEDPATLVQKIGRRRVSGHTHELYDVRTAKGNRWWVITGWTNMYPQDDFNSVDDAFTYHLGSTLQLMEQYAVNPDENQAKYINRAQRRYDQAVEAMGQATDAEDFQAVGIRCRETLLALAREHTNAPWVAEQQTPPKAADFKGWLGLYAEGLATGRVRTYLKNLAEKTWDLTVWLQHYADATEYDADLVLEATGHLLVTFMLTATRYEHGMMRRCPECDSYCVAEDMDVTEQNGVRGLLSNDVCLACGWTGEPSFESFNDRERKIADHKARRGG